MKQSVYVVDDNNFLKQGKISQVMTLDDTTEAMCQVVFCIVKMMEDCDEDWKKTEQASPKVFVECDFLRRVALGGS